LRLNPPWWRACIRLCSRLHLVGCHHLLS
jgi:hypothetical protein